MCAVCRSAPYTHAVVAFVALCLVQTHMTVASLDADEAAANGTAAQPPRRSKHHRNNHFLPLRLACETGVMKLTVTALDALAKLCAHSYFTGTSAVFLTVNDMTYTAITWNSLSLIKVTCPQRCLHLHGSAVLAITCS